MKLFISLSDRSGKHIFKWKTENTVTQWQRFVNDIITENCCFLISNDTVINWLRFECKPETSAIIRELVRLGTVSARSLKKNVMVPFSTSTVKLLLGQIPITYFTDGEDHKNWFGLEVILEEAAGYCTENPEIHNVCKKVCQSMLECLDDTNCFLIQRKLGDYDFHDFSDKALDFIKYNLARMIEEKTVDINFFRTDVEDLKILLDDDEMNVDPEDQILNVIDAWIEASPPDREGFRYFLMSSIRQKGLSQQAHGFFSENFELSQKPARKIRDVMIVLGGWLHKKATNNIEWFDVERNQWIRSSLQLPMKLAYHGAALIEEELYIYGGSDGTRFRCETWKLNSKTYTWDQCDLMFEARNFITNSSVVFENKIYVFGGQNGRDYAVNVRDHTRSRTGEYYDPKTDKWTKTAQMTDMRSDCAAAVYGNQIFIIGGFDGHNIIPTVEVYNPRGDFFILIDSLPNPLSGHSVVFHNSQLFVIGGYDGRTRQDKIFVWSKRGEWKLHDTKLKEGRSTSSACSYRDGIITVGGYSKYVDSECEVLFSNQDFRMPTLLQNKSACKVIIGNNWRSKLEAIGSVDLDEIVNIDSFGEEEFPIEADN